MGTNWLGEKNKYKQKKLRKMHSVHLMTISEVYARYEYLFYNLKVHQSRWLCVTNLFVPTILSAIRNKILNFHDAREGLSLKIDEFLAAKLIDKYVG